MGIHDVESWQARGRGKQRKEERKKEKKRGRGDRIGRR